MKKISVISNTLAECEIKVPHIRQSAAAAQAAGHAHCSASAASWNIVFIPAEQRVALLSSAD